MAALCLTPICGSCMLTANKSLCRSQAIQSSSGSPSGCDKLWSSHLGGLMGRGALDGVVFIGARHRGLQAHHSSGRWPVICAVGAANGAVSVSAETRQWTSVGGDGARDTAVDAGIGHRPPHMWRSGVMDGSRENKVAGALEVAPCRSHAEVKDGHEGEDTCSCDEHSGTCLEADACAELGVKDEDGSFEHFSSSQLQTASLSQALTGNVGRRLSNSVGSMNRMAVPRFARSNNTLTGPMAILMAMAVAVAGLATAMRSHMQQSAEIWSQESCANCEGYGHERCSVCSGSGEIRWEGKLYHTDPCPACLGVGIQKCGKCHGMCQGKNCSLGAVKEAVLAKKR